MKILKKSIRDQCKRLRQIHFMEPDNISILNIRFNEEE